MITTPKPTKDKTVNVHQDDTRKTVYRKSYVYTREDYPYGPYLKDLISQYKLWQFDKRFPTTQLNVKTDVTNSQSQQDGGEVLSHNKQKK